MNFAPSTAKIVSAVEPFFSLGGEVPSQTKVNHSQSTEPKQGPIVPVIRAVGEGVGLGAALFIL